jgi:hypothetical protein
VTVQTPRRAKLLSVMVVLWLANVAAWPGGLGYLEPAKPTLLAIIFVLVAHWLRVASWLLVVAFGLSFFLFSVVMLYFSPGVSPESGAARKSARADLFRGAYILAGHALGSALVWMRRLRLGAAPRPNTRFERTRAAMALIREPTIRFDISNVAYPQAPMIKHGFASSDSPSRHRPFSVMPKIR